MGITGNSENGVLRSVMRDTSKGLVASRAGIVHLFGGRIGMLLLRGLAEILFTRGAARDAS